MPTNPKDRNGREVVLGSHVSDTQLFRRGRVVSLSPWFSETTQALRDGDGGASWLSEQAVPVTNEEQMGVWASVLIDGGGSILSPVSRLEVTDEFPLNNPWSTFYFGEQQ